MKLVSWNINGFRAICTKPEWSWFDTTTADVVALQEVKAEPGQIPEDKRAPRGWTAQWLPASIKKGYSGVATFVRTGGGFAPAPLSVSLELPGFEGEGRLIHLEFNDFHFFNVYFPNGTSSEARLAYKMAYYKAFLEHAQNLRQSKPIVVCGDFNTAHRPIDLARPKENANHSGFLPEERAFLDSMIAAGYTDTFRLIHGDIPDMYSWWSYKFNARANNVGWRIDYFFVSNELVHAVRDAWIESSAMGSDHCPVGLEIEAS